MITIEKIEKVRGRKDIFKIFLDNEESVLVSADTIVKFGLKTDLTLSSLEYNKIIASDKSSRVVADALALVAKRSYSSKSLYDKLRQKGYEPENAKTAVVRLKELNYINDEKYAKELALYLAKRGKGGFAIKAELEKHSFDKNLINNAVEYTKCGKEPYEQIIDMMKSRFKKMDLKDKNEVRRTASFFLIRGFSSENIAKAFRKYKNISLEDND